MIEKKNLYRFEFEVLSIDTISVYADSIELAIEEFKLNFSESTWNMLSSFLYKITKVS